MAETLIALETGVSTRDERAVRGCSNLKKQSQLGQTKREAASSATKSEITSTCDTPYFFPCNESAGRMERIERIC